MKRDATQKDETTIVTEAISAVQELFNAPDTELTPAEKQDLPARIIEAIHPEGEAGLRIYLKPPLSNQAVLNVQYFTIYATFTETHVNVLNLPNTDD